LRKAELRALQRGRIRVEAALDLHGLTVEAARRRLQQFLDDALAAGLRCVRIVHGKGLRSGPAGPVLKSLVHTVLRAADGVAAFNDAPPADGGSGATIALLRSGRPRRVP
jgi:DNA-nicking Smr family endonuclease